MDSDRALSTGG